MTLNLGLYIHIPFCRERCRYCDFVSTTGGEESMQRYVSALIAQMRYCAEKYRDHSVDTVFIGGGTPSALYDGAIGTILSEVRDNFNSRYKEVTIECNPESLTRSKLDEYRAAGITRISIGVQSLNNDTLRALGRIHDSAKAVEAVKSAIAYGFDVSCDLMLGTPLQTVEQVEKDIDTLASCGVSHISAYMLTLEEGTCLKRDYDSGRYVFDDDIVADMYDAADRRLTHLGYDRYEVSNWAKGGKECKHNLKYWLREPYLGLGAAAHSLIDNIRFYNTRDVQEYVEQAKAGKFAQLTEAVLTPEQEDEETLMLGLRMSRGCDVSKIGNREFAKQIRERAYNNARFFDIKGDLICVKAEFMSVLSQLTLLLLSDK